MNGLDQAEIEHAKEQKLKEHADVAFASFATLNSDGISEVSIEDPEPLPLTGENLEKQLFRIIHYANIFDFIGEAKLSRYFKLLGKRLENDKNFFEFDEKLRLFEEIREKSTRVRVRNSNYLGKIELVGKVFLYVGFDERLISVDGFLTFKDHNNDETFEEGGGTFGITTDGICYGYIANTAKLAELIKLGNITNVNTEKIRNYMDSLSIYDLDSMLEFQLIDYIRYLFERNGFNVKKEVIEGTKRYDLVAIKNEKEIIVEIKKIR